MAIKDRLKQLRQERGLTQTQLAVKLGAHQKQISAYERGVTIPSTEVLIRIAEIFDVSLDYLAFEAEGKSAKVRIKDKELLKRFEEVDDLGEKDRKIILGVLDTFILKNRFQKLAVEES